MCHRFAFSFRLIALVGAFLLGPYPAHAVESEPLSPELALIPPDAAGFVTVRVADLWRAKPFGQMRQLLGDGGGELKDFYQDLYKTGIDGIERGTVVWPAAEHFGLNLVEVPGELRSRLLIVTTRKAMPVKGAFGITKAGARTHRGFTYYADAAGWTCVHPVGKRTAVMGSESAVRWLLEHRARKKPAGPLADAIRAADGANLIVLGAQPAVARKLLKQASPTLARSLGKVVGDAKVLTVTVAGRQDLDISARLVFPSAEAAGNAADALRTFGKRSAPGLRDHVKELDRKASQKENDADQRAAKNQPNGKVREIARFHRDALDWLERPPITLEGVAWTTRFWTPALAISTSEPLTGLLYVTLPAGPVFTTFREFSGRDEAVAKALSAYHKAHGHFPPAAVYSKEGNPLLSWRVAVLPYLGDEGKKLHAEFTLDEAWDGPRNKRLIDRMPWAFSDQTRNDYRPRPITPYRVFVGPGSVFEGPKGVSRKEIKDDPAHTFLAVRDGYGSVTWTRPEEILLKDGKPPAPGKGQMILSALFADGSVRELLLRNPVKIRAGVTRAGGEKVVFLDASRDPARLLEFLPVPPAQPVTDK